MEYQIIDQLKDRYSILELCRAMDVNRSGYYKWKERQGKKNIYEKNREELTVLLKEAHEKHRSYGYHRLATMIRNETGWLFSDNLAHKCCKYAGIRARVRHYNWKKTLMGQEHKQFPNIVKGKWNAKHPLEIVVSDMTIIRHKGIKYEWTYMLDTFNNEIIASHLSNIPGDRRPYFDCLADLTKKIKEQKKPVILHTDQGSIYSSRAFNNAHEKYNIIRSMSRAGKPTDNPIIESINGWIKAEMYSEGWHKRYSTASEMIETYVSYFNNIRPAYALQYKSPVQFRIEQGFL
ncbi:MAG: IS3 family transposase [Clostridiales bacterium]|nr:IS3 family transposase [Clostridiales bacterium]